MRDIDADILLVIKGEMIDPMTVYGTPRYTILWYQDDIFTTAHGRRDVANLAWAFDKTYTFDKCSLKMYEELGARDVDWLPLACDPEIHKPLDMPKEYDISMVGHMFPNRQELYKKLVKHFDKEKVLFTTNYQQYQEIVAKTKINLNLGIGPSGIQMRPFEVLAMKGFLLSNSIPEDGRLFEDRKHLTYYTDDNICDLIEYYLSTNAERDEIAERGHREVLDKHTYRHRMEKIIEDYNES